MPPAGMDLLLAEGLWAPSGTGTRPLVTTMDTVVGFQSLRSYLLGSRCGRS